MGGRWAHSCFGGCGGGEDEGVRARNRQHWTLHDGRAPYWFSPLPCVSGCLRRETWGHREGRVRGGVASWRIVQSRAALASRERP